MGMQNDMIAWNSRTKQTDIDKLVNDINQNIQWALDNDWMVVYCQELYHSRQHQFQCKSTPSYCVLESWGSKFHTRLYLPQMTNIHFAKAFMCLIGLDTEYLSDNAFYHYKASELNKEESGLRRLLESNQCKQLYICGLDMYDNNSMQNTHTTAKEYGFQSFLWDSHQSLKDSC